MMLRYLYLFRRSTPRLLETFFWPSIQIFIWGFLSIYISQTSSLMAQAFGVFLGGVMLWDVVFRSHLGFSICFMEEFNSRNLMGIYMSPLRPYEHVVSMSFISLIRTVAGLATASLLAWIFYDYSIYEMGLPLALFFTNTMLMGWAIALVICAVLLRYGIGAQSVAWVSVFVIAPFSCIYYPLSVLPESVQPFAEMIPTTHVFEGMRALLFDGQFRGDLLFNAFALNAVYLAVGIYIFLRTFKIARRDGLFLTAAE